MPSKLVGAVVAAVIGCGLAGVGGTVRAATLAGDQFDVSFFYPTRTTLYADEGTFTDPAKVPVPMDPNGRGTLGPSSIQYVFGQTVHFTPAAFDGLVVTDLTANRIRNVALSIRGSVTNLDASDLTFTANSISLNLSDVTVQAGSSISIAIAALSTPAPRMAFAEASALSVVPLPPAAPLFGAALLALGGIGYASRRGKAKAAA